MNIDFTQAQSAAETGISMVSVSAERANPGWVEEAAEALGWAATQFPKDAKFTVEQLRALTDGLASPPDLRAWGAATRRAAMLGYIVRTQGYGIAASSHNSPKPLYVAGNW